MADMDALEELAENILADYGLNSGLNDSDEPIGQKDLGDLAIIGGHEPVKREDLEAFFKEFPDLKKTFNACVTEERAYLLEEVGLTSDRGITNRANYHCVEEVIRPVDPEFGQ